MSNMKGSCMCGQISYDVDGEPGMVAVCHCPDCQKQTGTAFSIVVGINQDQLKSSGEMTVYETTGESGNIVGRHFCGKCGSPIYSAVGAMPGLLFLKAGTFEDTSWLEPQVEMFCDTAQAWVKLAGDWQRAPRNPPFG